VATIALAEPTTRFIFRGAPEAATAAGAAFGVALPAQPCSAQRQDSRAALWLGPDEWLLLAPREAVSDITSAFSKQLGGVPHSLVEISDRNVGLLLDGPGSEDMLNTGCPLDLDIAAFPAGMCTRTLFGKAEIVLWRTAPHVFHIEVMRSFLPYVTGFLDLAVRDVALAHR
jgi:sarcosine oxidase subunit gamma